MLHTCGVIKLTAFIPKDLHAKIKAQSAILGVSMAKLVCAALNFYLDSLKNCKK
jgi:hypothetical protein